MIGEWKKVAEYFTSYDLLLAKMIRNDTSFKILRHDAKDHIPAL